MSDNVSVTPGSGASVAADNVSGVLYQRIKVAYGTDGSATDVSSGSGFPVAIVSGTIALSGSDRIGTTGADIVVLKPTLTLSTSVYASGDTLAGEITLTNAAYASGGSVTLTDIVLTDDSAQGPAIDILLFDADPASTSVANGAFAWGAGDLAKLCAIVPIAAADWRTIGGEKIVQVPNPTRTVKAVGSANLYAHLVLTAGTPTFLATSLTAAFSFRQN